MSARLAFALLFIATWLLITGSASLANLAFGALISGFALFLLRDVRPPVVGRIRPLKLLRLIGLFFLELIKSGIRVAVLVCQRDMRLDPGIVAVPLILEGDFRIALLANLITLTPGTLSVDVSPDKSVIFVHCVAIGDPAAVIADIRDGFERAIREAFP